MAINAQRLEYAELSIFEALGINDHICVLSGLYHPKVPSPMVLYLELDGLVYAKTYARIRIPR